MVASNQEKDPDNLQLWRMNIRRAEAEMVRDSLLQVGGGMDWTMGGPELDQGAGESSTRRSVYFRHAKEKLMEFMKAPVQREEPGWYRVEMEGETFTLGHLLQELLYRDKNVEYVSRDIGHPLLPKLTVRFSTKQQPEQILETLKRGALELCENVLRSV